MQDGTDLGGDSEFRLETSGDADGFVTIIEEFGEVRGVTAIYSEENLRNAENDARISLVLADFGASVIQHSHIARQLTIPWTYIILCFFRVIAMLRSIDSPSLPTIH